MKDLDFDELDRAVNSLITSAPGSNDNNAKPLASSSTDLNIPQRQSGVSPAINVNTPLAGRRGTGRFMDVVRPSADMRTTPPVTEPVSRQGAMVNPMSKESLVENTPAQEPIESSPATSLPKHEWPDPIDFKGPDNNQMTNKEESVKDKNEDADIDQINDDITNALNQPLDESPDSPFIPGTKVEKRPLGAFSTESSTSRIEPSLNEPIPDKDNGFNMNEQQSNSSIDTPLPAELQDDLLSIESDSTTHPEMTSIPPSVEAAPMTTPVTPPVTPVAPANAVSQPVGATSIAQQYKEQPSSGDQNTGAIYDTDAYHKALVQPAKKKSGWLWVIWMVALILVGAGVGAVVYNFML